MSHSPNDITISEIIQLLSARFPQIDLPASFLAFIRLQEEVNHQLRRPDSGKLLVHFLEEQQAPASYVSSFLSTESHLLPKIDYSHLRQLPTESIYSYLVDHLAHVFELQQVALDSEVSTGFNSHGREHVCTVARSAVSLLKESNLVSVHNYNEKEAVLGGLLHDIGNLISRHHHGLYGLYLLTRLFKNFSIDESTLESFLTVLEIVVFHEVEFGTQQALFETLNPATLSVIIADKTDVSFQRVNTKSNVPDATQDAHVLVNLLVARSSTRREVGHTGRFYWTVDFRTKFDADLFSLFSSLVKATGRVRYPKEWISLYEAGHIEYLFLFQSTFLSTYLTRLFFAMRAVFALYPSVDEFLLVIDDAERGISLTRAFTREDYREKIRTLGKLFYRDAWPEMYLNKAL